jgi:hypothetical protein
MAHVEWFELSEVMWEGLDLRFVHFHFSILKRRHPSEATAYLLGLCSPDYENTCIPLGYYRDLEAAQSAAMKVGDFLFATATPY